MFSFVEGGDVIQILLSFIVAAVAQDSFVQGKGQVFTSNPISATQKIDLQDDSPVEDFKTAYQMVDFPEVFKDEAGLYFLKSSYVEVLELDFPVNETFENLNGEWVFERGTDGFRSAMAFYHLDNNVRYVRGLGFKDAKEIPHTPIKVDPNGLNGSAGSAFLPARNQIIFGTGCIDAVEDADEIHRMYFHSLVNGVKAGEYLFGGDVEAIIEGFADYWAASRSLSAQDMPFVGGANIFKWTSVGNCRSQRNLESPFLIYEIEKDYKGSLPMVAGFTNEVWSTPLFQSLLQSLKEGVSHEDLDRLFVESLSFLESDLKMPQMSEKLVELALELYPTQKISEILKENFLIQDLMPRARLRFLEGSMDTADLTVGTKGAMSLNMSNLGFKAAGTVDLKVISHSDNIKLLKEKESISNFAAKSETKEEDLFLFEALKGVCSEEGFLEIEATYEGQRSPLVFKVSFEITPLSFAKAVNKEIPDDSLRGVESTLEIKRLSRKIKYSVEVGVNIEHQYRGDLILTIIHPNGEEVKLWKGRPGDNRDNINAVFPRDLNSVDSLDVLTELSHKGEWTFLAHDLSRRNVGMLKEWSLRFVAEKCIVK